MPSPTPQPNRLRVAHLNPRSPTTFSIRPDADARAAIAQELGITALSALRFDGSVRPEGGDAWRLTGTLDARVVQPCVVTLQPVKTDLSEQVIRVYSPHLATPEGEEIEMPDETLEPLGQFIDLQAAMIEELALALPEYPRAEGADLPDTPDEAPPADTRRPFEGLDKLLRRDSE